jgi:hypothetical protein
LTVITIITQSNTIRKKSKHFKTKLWTMRIPKDHSQRMTKLCTLSPRSNNDIIKDLINLTEVTFYPSSAIAQALSGPFFINLFLVLGDYVLVVGRAMSAIFDDQICFSVAGAIASLLMFGLCQYGQFGKDCFPSVVVGALDCLVTMPVPSSTWCDNK